MPLLYISIGACQDESIVYNKDMNYEERDQKIALAYTNGEGTLASIGELFGITRERVRQILKKGGIEERWQWHRKKIANIREAAKTTSATELMEHFGLSRIRVSQLTSDIRKPISGNSAIARGRKGEDWFIKQCRLRGFNTVPQLARCSFDVLVNDKKVDVKIRNMPTLPPSRAKRKHRGSIWSWSIRGNKNPADYYACIIAPTEEIFIIPHEALPSGFHTGANNLLCITWPNTWSKKPKYEKYLSAWHLLK